MSDLTITRTFEVILRRRLYIGNTTSTTPDQSSSTTLVEVIDYQEGRARNCPLSNRWVLVIFSSDVKRKGTQNIVNSRGHYGLCIIHIKVCYRHRCPLCHTARTFTLAFHSATTELGLKNKKMKRITSRYFQHWQISHTMVHVQSLLTYRHVYMSRRGKKKKTFWRELEQWNRKMLCEQWQHPCRIAPRWVKGK